MKVSKSWIYGIVVATLAAVLILGGTFTAQAATATSDSATLQQPGPGGRGGSGHPGNPGGPGGPGNPGNPGNPGLPPAGTVDAQETEDLLWMREEEKVARDVYLTLDEKWDLSVFANISKAEQQHMDALLTLLTRYGIDDPVVDDAIGKFTNPELQDLYDTLVAQGVASQEAALNVGAIIEEVDILDLEKAIAHTDNADILQVYKSLTCGSDNHLRAFVGMLEATTGQSYTPQYLDQAAYDAIMNGSQGGCGQGQHGRRHGRRGGHGRHDRSFATCPWQ